MMIDVAEQQTARCLVNDEPDVALTRTDQKFLSLALSSLWKLHARAGRVHLQIERRRLHRLLLVAGQPREAVGEGVGNEKFMAHLGYRALQLRRLDFHGAMEP